MPICNSHVANFVVEEGQSVPFYTMPSTLDNRLFSGHSHCTKFDGSISELIRTSWLV